MIKSLFAAALILSGSVGAYAEELLLEDINSDGVVSYLAYGDSLTWGVGDGIEPGVVVTDLDGSARYQGGGYPARVAALSGIQVINAGVAGENLISAGLNRYPRKIAGSAADIVGIMEGANDAIQRVDPSLYARNIQRLINVTSALGRKLMLIATPPPCCNHDGPDLFIRAYNQEMRDLAAYNNLPIADLERAWKTTCENQLSCELFNLPEGLHPNKRGYDVIAQVVLAALYEIDIFAPDGASRLEAALGLKSGTVIVQPDIASQS